jgi:hypothetical protein
MEHNWLSTVQFSVGVLLLLFPSTMFSDGIVFDASSQRPLMELEQRAAISYREGTERMIIAIHFEAKDAHSAVWIFPVPAPPERTKIDVVDRFPTFHGDDPRWVASQGIHLWMLLARFTQIWPVIFDSVFLVPSRSFEFMDVEKYGIRAEVIAAASPDALAAFFRTKNVQLSGEQLANFQPYFSRPHAFVVAWIASRDDLRKASPVRDENLGRLWGRSPCLYVEFPTDKAFYPLRPTSAYGEKVVTLRLFILDYVQPETHLSHRDQLRVTYYRQSGFYENTPAQFTVGLPHGVIEYTKVEGSIPALEFDDDLSFSFKRPPGMKIAQFFNSRGDVALVAGWVVLVVVVSYISAGIAAWSILGKWKGYATLGMINLLTCIGLLLFIRFAPVQIAKDLRTHRWRFWRRFSIIYVSLTIVLQFLFEMLLSY